MRDRELARQMLSMAREDLDALQRMLNDPGFSESIFGFHAQQAVEKALKALLTALGVEFPKTHDLEMLDDLLSGNATDIPEVFRSLLDLSSFGVRFRYQPYGGFYEPLDRSATVQLIDELVSFVQTQIAGA